jgi:putative ABC transport system permease protein
MLAVDLLIAFLGIVNTMALSVVERTREIGLLRALGTLRGQVRPMVLIESVLITITVSSSALASAWRPAD